MKYRSLFNRKGLSLERMSAFSEVAEHGSIVAATGGDPARQALVSRQISELESFFETALVERKGRGLILTEAGRELAFLIRESLGRLQEFASSQKGDAWALRMVASNTVGQWLILPQLPELREVWPEVRWQLQHEQTREMLRKVQEGIADVAVVRKQGPDLPGLQTAALGNLTYSLYLPLDKAGELPRKCSLARALTSCPLALPIGGSMRERIERLAARVSQPLKVVFEGSSYLQTSGALRSGASAAVLPDIAISAGERPLYRRIPVPDTVPMVLMWRNRSAERNPRLALLINRLQDFWKIPKPPSAGE
ncbi:MAG: LysR family transcriptional regulator [Opitutales bacterium]|nr:LysR family transcriptional regulator [Opitutales bacterium]